ncbi:LLM class flavin-dependent oxidoreductase [Nitrospirillum viridazoti]|uniref:LLM class flavin-dependent oxidoreductase n=1 Tax=Nitrospirillum viridazoti CBAmc TaxID=1441467 RepID=A0A248JZE2_9PROT|nr:LLM class flavin-dependent oxidoreductase [Nitrospirillum amazonense]ASG23920.1 LLM class flavin-dependent oxidoreductase [Nitrospirillum amazonense CBAmc]TWB44644.1 pyrimidine oxygenase [Nitrospirillum amazonense]
MTQTTELKRAPLPSDAGGKDLGIFLPIANGGWILSSSAPRIDGSYAYNRRVAQLADGAGYDFIMAMAKWRGYGGATEHWRYAMESQMMMAGLAEVTKEVKVWATVHTLLQNPAVTAKMIMTLDHISQGRAGLNVVNGSYKGEFEQMGAWRDELDHDERYTFAEEWVHAIKRLWTEDTVDYQGKYVTLTDCQSDPKPFFRPFLVCAGSSKRGMAFTINEMDAIFLSGSSKQELAKNSGMAKAMAKEAGRSIKTYSMMTLVLGDTDAEAEALAARYVEGFDEGAWRGMMKAYGFLDVEIGRQNDFTTKAKSGFMSSHLVGAPATIAAKLIDMLGGCDLDGMMLIFPDYITGVPRFAQEVLPAIREAFPTKV